MTRWFARNLPAIHLLLVLLAAFIHGQNIHRAVGCQLTLPVPVPGRASPALVLPLATAVAGWASVVTA